MEHMKSSGGTDIKERPPKRIKAKPRPPRQFRVVYHNDDYTPIEFVSWTLQAFLNKTEEEANSLTLEIHKSGRAIAGIYDMQIAETKIHEVMECAKENQYPLSVTGEPIE